MLSIFVGQPFIRRTEDEILERREEIVKKVCGEDVSATIIDVHRLVKDPKHPILGNLSAMLLAMESSNLVVFSTDYTEDPEVCAYHCVCHAKHIAHIHEDLIEPWGGRNPLRYKSENVSMKDIKKKPFVLVCPAKDLRKNLRWAWTTNIFLDPEIDKGIKKVMLNTRYGMARPTRTTNS